MSVILGIGSNIGDSKTFIAKAISLIGEKFRLLKESSLYETVSLLRDDQRNYYNKVITVECDLSPDELLLFIKELEVSIGRNKNPLFWGAREIDIDIIDHNGTILDCDKLTIPHKCMSERSFVLIPLKEVDANYIHPATLESIDNMIAQLKDDLNIKIIDSI